MSGTGGPQQPPVVFGVPARQTAAAASPASGRTGPTATPFGRSPGRGRGTPRGRGAKRGGRGFNVGMRALQGRGATQAQSGVGGVPQGRQPMFGVRSDSGLAAGSRPAASGGISAQSVVSNPVWQGSPSTAFPLVAQQRPARSAMRGGRGMGMGFDSPQGETVVRRSARHMSSIPDTSGGMADDGGVPEQSHTDAGLKRRGTEGDGAGGRRSKVRVREGRGRTVQGGRSDGGGQEEQEQGGDDGEDDGMLQDHGGEGRVADEEGYEDGQELDQAPSRGTASSSAASSPSRTPERTMDAGRSSEVAKRKLRFTLKSVVTHNSSLLREQALAHAARAGLPARVSESGVHAPPSWGQFFANQPIEAKKAKDRTPSPLPRARSSTPYVPSTASVSPVAHTPVAEARSVAKQRKAVARPAVRARPASQSTVSTAKGPQPQPTRPKRPQQEVLTTRQSRDAIEDEELGDGAGEVYGVQQAGVVGTCMTMCPVEDLAQARPHVLEERTGLDLTETMVKGFERDPPLHYPLSRLRPPAVLLRTLQYMEDALMDKGREGCDRAGKPFDDDRGWGQVTGLESYVWHSSRLRMIAKELTMQGYAHGEKVSSISIRILERLTRFYIAYQHRLNCEPEFLKDHAKINLEQLTSSIATLGRLYQYARILGQPGLCGNEAEFRAYAVLLVGDVQEALEKEAREDDVVQHTLEVRMAVDVMTSVHTGNYVRFFRLLRDAPYLLACLMAKHVPRMRQHALATMARVFSSKPSAVVAVSVDEMTRRLLFADITELTAYVLSKSLDIRDGMVLLPSVLPPEVKPEKKAEIEISQVMLDSYPSIAYVELKAGGIRLKDITRGIEGALRLDEAVEAPQRRGAREMPPATPSVPILRRVSPRASRATGKAAMPLRAPSPRSLVQSAAPQVGAPPTDQTPPTAPVAAPPMALSAPFATTARALLPTFPPSTTSAPSLALPPPSAPSAMAIRRSELQAESAAERGRAVPPKKKRTRVIRPEQNMSAQADVENRPGPQLAAQAGQGGGLTGGAGVRGAASDLDSMEVIPEMPPNETDRSDVGGKELAVQRMVGTRMLWSAFRQWSSLFVEKEVERRERRHLEQGLVASVDMAQTSFIRREQPQRRFRASLRRPQVKPLDIVAVVGRRLWARHEAEHGRSVTSAWEQPLLPPSIGWKLVVRVEPRDAEGRVLLDLVRQPCANAHAQPCADPLLWKSVTRLVLDSPEAARIDLCLCVKRATHTQRDTVERAHALLFCLGPVLADEGAPLLEYWESQAMELRRSVAELTPGVPVMICVPESRVLEEFMTVRQARTRVRDKRAGPPLRGVRQWLAERLGLGEKGFEAYDEDGVMFEWGVLILPSHAEDGSPDTSALHGVAMGSLQWLVDRAPLTPIVVRQTLRAVITDAALGALWGNRIETPESCVRLVNDAIMEVGAELCCPERRRYAWPLSEFANDKDAVRGALSLDVSACMGDSGLPVDWNSDMRSMRLEGFLDQLLLPEWDGGGCEGREWARGYLQVLRDSAESWLMPVSQRLVHLVEQLSATRAGGAQLPWRRVFMAVLTDRLSAASDDMRFVYTMGTSRASATPKYALASEDEEMELIPPCWSAQEDIASLEHDPQPCQELRNSKCGVASEATVVGSPVTLAVQNVGATLDRAFEAEAGQWEDLLSVARALLRA